MRGFLRTVSGLVVCACALTATGATGRTAPLPSAQPGPPSITVFHGATLIDGTGAPPRGPVTIIVQNGRIRTIAGPGIAAPRRGGGAASAFGPPAEIAIPPGATVIDLTGRWIMPGLVDVHAHMPGNTAVQPEVLRTYLAFGITTARSTSSIPSSGVALRQKLEAGELIGPRFLTSGTFIDGPTSAFNAPIVATPGEARDEVRRQAAAGVDLIKVYSQMTPDLVAAAIDEAHALGLPVTGHLGKTRWHEAAAMGIDHVTHSAYSGMFSSLVPDEFYDTVPAYRFFYSPPQAGGFIALLLTNHWLSVFDPGGPELARLIDSMRAHGVTWDPNLVTSEAVLFGDDPANLARYEPAFAPAGWLAAWTGLRHPYSYWWTASMFSAAQSSWPIVLEIVRRVHEGGVALTAGSDNNNPWMTPGVALHRELELLASAGIPAADIIRIATRNGAHAARVLDETGTIAPGKSADFIVLTADPLADIRNTRAIERVYLRGVGYTPQGLLGGRQ